MSTFTSPHVDVQQDNFVTMLGNFFSSAHNELLCPYHKTDVELQAQDN